MDKKHIIAAALMMAALTVAAVPAKRGVTARMVQPDGTVVTLSVHGDEHRHYYMTTDSQVVIATDDGYRYAVVGDDGRPVASQQLAHDAESRNTAEALMLKGIDQEAVRQSFAFTEPPRLRASHSGMGTTAPDYPTRGRCKSLVILVEYADVSFTTEDAYGYFNAMLNEHGFDKIGGTGSARDYYIDCSNGLYEPEFDVYGPVTLPQDRSYYGGNDNRGEDKRPQYMMLHAAEAIDDQVDFSQYDLDGDKVIDNVFIIYAGRGENSGGGADCVWAHEWEWSFNQKFDGVKLYRYGCAPEMITIKKPDGIGTFCHEFAHVLGLPDLYNTDKPDANYTPQEWSLMDGGCYNNNSRTPPALSAFERNALGWMDDYLYEPTTDGAYTLEPLTTTGQALLLPTQKDSEYFILENRQQTGWDTYLPSHGMLVWHIDYLYNVWYNNTVNNKKSHQYVDIVEACGTPNAWEHDKYVFPGPDQVTELRYGGKPSLQNWKGNDIGYALTDIREEDGVIRLNLTTHSGINDITGDDTGWTVTGRHLSGGDTPLTVSDLSGRVIAAGPGVSIDLSAGLYIISTPYATSKLLIP